LWAAVEGREIPLYQALAERLLAKYGLVASVATPEGDPAPNGTTVLLRPYHELNDAVCALARRGRRVQDLYRPINELLKALLDAPAETALQPLRNLASIGAFRLFVTTTPDDLLARAIDAERHGGMAKTEHIVFAPKLASGTLSDLPEVCSSGYTQRPGIRDRAGPTVAGKTSPIRAPTGGYRSRPDAAPNGRYHLHQLFPHRPGGGPSGIRRLAGHRRGRGLVRQERTEAGRRLGGEDQERNQRLLPVPAARFRDYRDARGRLFFPGGMDTGERAGPPYPGPQVHHPVVVDRDYDGNADRYRLVPASFPRTHFGHAPEGGLSDELLNELRRLIRERRSQRPA
jgi:hypothetical protein